MADLDRNGGISFSEFVTMMRLGDIETGSDLDRLNQESSCLEICRYHDSGVCLSPMIFILK